MDKSLIRLLAMVWFTSVSAAIFVFIERVPAPVNWMTALAFIWLLGTMLTAAKVDLDLRGLFLNAATGNIRSMLVLYFFGMPAYLTANFLFAPLFYLPSRR